MAAETWDGQLLVIGAGLIGTSVGLAARAGASAELSRDRPWVICPPPATTRAAPQDITQLARLCGAAPITLPADAHDRLLAQLSHVPQLVASALAASLHRLPDGQAAL